MIAAAVQLAIIVFSTHAGGVVILAAGPVAGFLIYGAIYRRYRNADKTYAFERETVVAETTPITGSDTKVDELRGTRDSRVRGDNSGDDRQRVQRLQYPTQ